VPFAVDNPDRKETKEAKLNLGAIVALGAFGGFVFLAAVITTIVILKFEAFSKYLSTEKNITIYREFKQFFNLWQKFQFNFSEI